MAYLMTMVGETVSHYKILEKLGSGGMGVVYKAQDAKLDRFVALKFLPPHLSQAEEEKQRFIQEAKAASALDHPNICTIYEIDETEDGQMFIAMACYEGETLKSMIDDRRLTIEEAIHYAIQIAEGLQAAHRKRIIHRDIKPANIIITNENVAKIVDFGLAKLTGRTMLTKEGTTLGTVAYMSPEQAQGAEVDHRTDIWSLGVVLYELLTGKHPFQGDYEQAIIYFILNEEPEPINNSKDDVSVELQRIVNKTLQKEQGHRYDDMNALLKDLKSISAPTASASSTTGRAEEKAIPSIAVLPFANMSADKEQEYFCDGMAEEIINALVKVEGLRVAARTSAFMFKGKHEDVREIGRKLNVEMVLEGSVRKAGHRLRITAQLIKVADGFHVWSERYDRELEDVFAIQDDISRAIVTALKIRLRVAEEKPLVKRPTENLEAYDAYLRGIYCYNQRTKKDNDKAIEIFEQATALDPAFALAFAALAYAYVEKFFTYQPQKKWEQKAFVAIEKALSIDPELAEAYVAKGLLIWTKSHHFPHENAITEYQRAIVINPNLAEAHSELARVLWHIGLLDKAYEALKKAMQISPTDVRAQFRMGWLEMHRGNYTQALSLLKKVQKESIAEWLDALIAMSLLYLHKKDEAVAQLEQVDESFADDPAITSTEAIILVLDGKEKDATVKIKRAIEKGKNLGHFHHISYNIAAAYAVMNKKKVAIDWLQKTADDGFPCYPWFQMDPCLDNLRSDARFVALMQSLREQWQDYEAGS
jgi:TolB-like protein/lipopolysaccharide biosynthesis regulator YciM